MSIYEIGLYPEKDITLSVMNATQCIYPSSDTNIDLLWKLNGSKVGKCQIQQKSIIWSYFQEIS